MSFIDRASFLIERIGPHLPAGKPPRNQPTREELEREAQAELQARIDQGRPGPEEARRTRPLPEWARPARPRRLRRPSRPLDAVTVRLDAIVPPPPAPAADVPRPKARTAGQTTFHT